MCCSLSLPGWMPVDNESVWLLHVMISSVSYLTWIAFFKTRWLTLVMNRQSRLWDAHCPFSRDLPVLGNWYSSFTLLPNCVRLWHSLLLSWSCLGLVALIGFSHIGPVFVYRREILCLCPLLGLEGACRFVCLVVLSVFAWRLDLWSLVAGNASNSKLSQWGCADHDPLLGSESTCSTGPVDLKFDWLTPLWSTGPAD